MFLKVVINFYSDVNECDTMKQKFLLWHSADTCGIHRNKNAQNTALLMVLEAFG